MKKLKKPLQKSAKPKVSTSLKIYDIPVDHIEESPENPNEEDEATFDLLVEAIKEDGLDEPCIVVPKLDDRGKETGHFIMVSGHHRRKAAAYLDITSIPCVIKSGWDDDARKIQIVKRNILGGNLNPDKFTQLYNDLAKRYDKEILRQMMGFTKSDAFKKVYKAIEGSVTASQKKQLEEAKEDIKSVDDLSSVLNRIFKDNGSDLDHGFMVFSFGGKNHHYFKSDKELDVLLEDFEAAVRKYKLNTTEAFKGMLKSLDMASVPKTKSTRKLKRKPKEKKDAK